MSHDNRTRRLFVAASTLLAGLVVSIAPTVATADEIPENVPNPPTNVDAEPEPGKVTVTWNAPVDGPAVVDYVAVAVAIDGPDVPPCVRLAAPGGVVATSFTCEFDNLTDNLEYRISVRSRNALGDSPRRRQTVVLAVPGLEDAFAIPQDESIIVRWEQPGLKGFGHDSPFEYTWSVDPADAGECVTAGLECTFAGLTNGTTYRIVGSTTNDAGVGGDYTFLGVTPDADAPTITTLPNPPTDVDVGVGDTKLAVGWTAPTAGSEVVDYVVTARPGDGQCITTGLACEITGLDNGTDYRIRVASRNAGGSRSVSPGVFTPRPPGYAQQLPKPPARVRVRPGSTSVAVSWDAPVDEPGGEIDDYVVSVEPGGHSCTTTSLTCSISGLTNGTEYTLRARSRNEVGLRSASPQTFTPEAPDTPIVAMVPKRIFESRVGPGFLTADGLEQNTGPVQARRRTVIEMAGRVGVPLDAKAVVLNLTAITPTNAGFATLYPCAAEPPTASTVNYSSGQVIANSALISLSAKGTFCVFSSSQMDLAIDVTGFVPVDSDLVAVNPARLYESRVGAKLVTVDGEQQNEGRLAAGEVVTVNIGGRGTLPTTMAAALLNVAVVGPSAAGFLTLYPCDEKRPTASTLNHAAGQTIANGATVKVDPNGDVCIFTRSAADVIVDFVGYAPDLSALTTVTPARLYETRAGNVTRDGSQQATGRRTARQVTTINVAGRAGVADEAGAVIVNVAAIGPSGPGYVTLFPCNEKRPLASTLNYAVGQVVANGATVKLDPSGDICAFTLGDTDLIVDVTGYLPG